MIGIRGKEKLVDWPDGPRTRRQVRKRIHPTVYIIRIIANENARCQPIRIFNFHWFHYNLILNQRWYWEHNEEPLGFSSWIRHHPNIEIPNSDDCAFMDTEHGEYDWKDVLCYEEDVQEFKNIYPTSFICQKGKVNVETTITSISTTTPLYNHK